MADEINVPWQTVERQSFPDGRVTIAVDGKAVFDGYQDGRASTTELTDAGPLNTRELFQSDSPEDFRNFNVSDKTA